MVRSLGLDVRQKDFAVKMGVKEPIISMYMSSKRHVSLNFLKRFCEEYHLDYAEMIKPDKPEPELDKKAVLSDRDLIGMFLQVSGAQTEILKDIKKQMAQETTQARIEDKVNKIGTNLTETLTGVEFVSGRQLQKILAALNQLQESKKTPSRGVRKKLDENDGDGHKSGIKP
jgi:transcriptional regulator with XRE-family HTH domain